jgi:uncharacterized protein YyaL (SSP411 family)
MRQTADYVLREMIDSTGAFYSAQDAEVHGREGANYLWTTEQARDAIGDGELTDLATTLYGLDRGTNFRDPHDPDAEAMNVLYLADPLDRVAEQKGLSVNALMEKREQINQMMLAARDQRDQPGTDDKVLVSWNGLMIAGLARAGLALEATDCLDAARRAADAIQQHLQRDDGSLHRTMRQGRVALAGQLEDYALLAHGLIELHRATGEQSLLEKARRLVAKAIELFAAEAGGYFDTPAEANDLMLRLSTAIDGAVPSGNSQMVHNLLDLYELTGEQAHLDRAVTDLHRFATPLSQQGRAMPHMAHALLRGIALSPNRLSAASETAGAGADESDPVTAPEPVRVLVERDTLDLSNGADEVLLHVEPAEGYHINAHEPGDPALVPMTVMLEDAEGLRLHVDYLKGQPRQYPFADQPIHVYATPVTLSLQIEQVGHVSSDARPTLAVRYQPCSDRACLEPRTERIALQLQ